MTEEKAEPKTSDQQPTIPLYRNIVSHLGMLVMLISASLMLLALVFQLTTGGLSPYVGIITWMVFPAILALGLVTILLGMRWEAGRRRRVGALPTLPYPQIDLNERRQRIRFGVVVVGGSIVAVLLCWASYNAFLYTETVEFCGTICHQVMEPEYTAYQYSAHARVPCVDCHVGEGAGWYVKSKLSGVRQVFAVLFNTYERPIPVPIKHLRPARETCERCHWPEKFYGATLVQLPHYRYDESNSPEQISLTLKTGGGSKEHGASAGIHWHMLVDNTITFAASDEKHLQIPWMEVRHSDGSKMVYRSKRRPISDADLARLEKHQMDCMDCHNRPSHGYPNPDGAIDDALYRGLIARDLPWIKKLCVDGMMKDYADRDQAHQGIRQTIVDFYQQKYTSLLEQRQADVDAAVAATTAIYDRGVFPKMKVDWRSYPSNIGHRYWPGCFRCHDGDHFDAEGKVLAHDCARTCHTMPQRGLMTSLGETDPFAGKDWHPWQMPAAHVSIKAHENVLCYQCHAAGQRPKRECNECHQ